jgi:acetyltransferase-like isoleucine patch superfamily enzyme
MINPLSAARILVRALSDVWMLLVIYMPGETGVLLRRRYYGKRLRKCGANLVIRPGVHLSGLECIEIGDDVMIRENAIIQTGKPLPKNKERRSVQYVARTGTVEPGLVVIGNKSRIAHGVMILGYGGVVLGEKCGVGPGAIMLSESFHHKGHDRAVVYKYSQGANLEEQCIIQGGIELRDGAGVASNVVVLPGAIIGKDSWVLPNSLVRVGGRIPNMVIAKGDPAVTIQQRFPSDGTNVG